MHGHVDEDVFSAGQLADILGCSIRSIYRWEETGVIPTAQRVERGGVSARVYTASQVEEIRQRVQGRITFTAIVRDQVRQRRRGTEPKKVIITKRRGVLEEVRAHLEDATVFLKALKFARKHGCKQLVITGLDGRTQNFVADSSVPATRQENS
jgi:DNA-binding transcriptional MerR regulator